MPPPIILRDVQVPPAPPWWPPAPGWWVVAGVLALSGLAWWWWRRGARRRRREAGALFDDELARADSPVQRLATASELLRRAARRSRPDADRLQGDDWLDFLDGDDDGFREGDGRLLLDGPFRPRVDADAAARAVSRARERFVALMVRS